MLTVCALFATITIATTARMEGFIVGGNYSTIEEFPHMAFLKMTCLTPKMSKVYWICGSSIVNQVLLLTAAHCLDHCLKGTGFVVISFGHEDRTSGLLRSSNNFVIHENYRAEAVVFDIALIKVKKPFSFGSRIQRVALMKETPYMESAYIAGWGLIDEVRQVGTKKLKHVYQKVLPLEYCKQLLENFPAGAFCASNPDEDVYPSSGDSGSALLVEGYIQIGVVSYKEPDTANNVLVYTDVGYYYDWIECQARSLYCSIPCTNETKSLLLNSTY